MHNDLENQMETVSFSKVFISREPDQIGLRSGAYRTIRIYGVWFGGIGKS